MSLQHQRRAAVQHAREAAVALRCQCRCATILLPVRLEIASGGYKALCSQQAAPCCSRRSHRPAATAATADAHFFPTLQPRSHVPHHQPGGRQHLQPAARALPQPGQQQQRPPAAAARAAAARPSKRAARGASASRLPHAASGHRPKVLPGAAGALHCLQAPQLGAPAQAGSVWLPGCAAVFLSARGVLCCYALVHMRITGCCPLLLRLFVCR